MLRSGWLGMPSLVALRLAGTRLILPLPRLLHVLVSLLCAIAIGRRCPAL